MQIHDLYIDTKNGITTPREAIYFWECVAGEELTSFPSTYYEYIEKIVHWKAKELADCSTQQIQNTVLAIIDCVIKNFSCVIEGTEFDSVDIGSLRKVQLLSPTITVSKSIFSVSQAFRKIAYITRTKNTKII